MRELTHLSLFSGIGGIDLAAHWAGFRTVAFCEREPFCQAVLRKNFGHDGIIYDDVRDISAESLRERGVEWPYLISGGFPCQDISCAGKGEGLAGSRSGLWFEMLRVIREVQPVWVVAENVPALRTRGIDTVLAGLEETGYTAVALVVGAWAVGAPQQRNRVFVLAHSRRRAGYTGPERAGWETWTDACGGGEGAAVAHTAGQQQQGRCQTALCQCHRPVSAAGREDIRCQDGCSDPVVTRPAYEVVADPNGPEWRTVAEGDQPDRHDARWQEAPSGFKPCRQDLADTDGAGCSQQRLGISGDEELAPSQCSGRRQSEPGLGGAPARLPARLDGPARWPAGVGQEQEEWEAPRLAKSVPNRLARLKALGNAVNPEQAYPILQVIADYE